MSAGEKEKPRLIAIVQARTGSTRLPRKALLDICGKTMLARVVRRARRAALLNDVVVATTTKREDGAIVAEAESLGAPVFRGSENDLLDRYYRAARAFGAEAVARITSDCPLADPEIIDMVTGEFLKAWPDVDFCSNSFPRRTYPRGLDVSVVSLAALEAAWREDRNPGWREHVTPYITRNPGLFRIVSVTNAEDLSRMRWTVDTREDLEFVRHVYAHFGHDRFSWREVLQLLERHPEWAEINIHIRQKEIR